MSLLSKYLLEFNISFNIFFSNKYFCMVYCSLLTNRKIHKLKLKLFQIFVEYFQN